MCCVVCRHPVQNLTPQALEDKLRCLRGIPGIRGIRCGIRWQGHGIRGISDLEREYVYTSFFYNTDSTDTTFLPMDSTPDSTDTTEVALDCMDLNSTRLSQ